MRLALVASSYLPRPGALERHVDELARGLTRRGAEVEVLVQDAPRVLPPVSDFEGFVVRRFASPVTGAHLAVAPGLWEHLRRAAASFDLVDAHSGHAALAVAVARAHPRRFVFTPHTPVRRLLRWPNTRLTRALVQHAAQTVCAAAAEGELLGRTFPWAASRIAVVPPGVDRAGIQAARPFPLPGSVVLTHGRLERHKGIDRAIAAIAALDPAFRLAVVGEGPARHKLLAHAVDLQVSSRIEFVGAVPDAELHRWLRTARVGVALAEQDSSGLQVTEALAAGTPVVASDIPVHREAAARVGGAGVRFLAPTGSPLELADAICEAAELSVPRTAASRIPSWDELVERTLAVYSGALHGTPSAAGAPEAA
jgi:glycosyltransferase involved in cell wall biosynthesis